jgi:hypothetical protein
VGEALCETTRGLGPAPILGAKRVNAASVASQHPLEEERWPGTQLEEELLDCAPALESAGQGGINRVVRLKAPRPDSPFGRFTGLHAEQ